MAANCNEHPSFQGNCFDCLVAELIQLHDVLVQNVKNLQAFNQRISSVMKFRKLQRKKLNRSQKSLFDSIAIMLNSQILKSKGENKSLSSLKCTFELSMSSKKDKVPMYLNGAGDYKAFIKQRGNWGGFTEICALARLFDVCFSLYMKQTERALVIGGQCRHRITNFRLSFTGDHYVVEDTENSSIIPTNRLGDCMFEAFLVLMLCGGALSWSKFSEKEEMLRNVRSIQAGRINQELQTGPPLNALIQNLRDYLADNMDQTEIENATIATGRERTSSKKVKSEKTIISNLNNLVVKNSNFNPVPGIPEVYGVVTEANIQVTAGQSQPYKSNLYWMGFGAPKRPKSTDLDRLVTILGMNTTIGIGSLMKSTGLIKSNYFSLRDEFVGRNATHFGICVAAIETDQGVVRYICAASNIVHKGKKRGTICRSTKDSDNGLHTEMYCIKQLRFVLVSVFGLNKFALAKIANKSVSNLSAPKSLTGLPKVECIRLYFLLEKPMCMTQCHQGLNRFIQICEKLKPPIEVLFYENRINRPRGT